jgi:hypothetical protein
LRGGAHLSPKGYKRVPRGIIERAPLRTNLFGHHSKYLAYIIGDAFASISH